MGSCLSKDKPEYKGSTRPVGTQNSGNRVGGTKKQAQNTGGAGRKLGTAAAGPADAKPKNQSAPFAGQGRLMTDSNRSGAADSTVTGNVSENPREAAARAAQARLDAAKSKSGTGKLGKKLEEERQKNKMTLLAESAADNNRTERLIYD